MTNKFLLRAMLVSLVALASGLGWSGAGEARPLAAAAPRVEVYGGLARRGFPRQYHFRVEAEGPVTLRATLRVRGRTALSGTMRRVSPRWDYRDAWKPRAISRALPGQTYYTFCIVATSAGGNAKHCARVTVV
jgi:hypothetical protein